jgi:hypothetical protein
MAACNTVFQIIIYFIDSIKITLEILEKLTFTTFHSSS